MSPTNSWTAPMAITLASRTRCSSGKPLPGDLQERVDQGSVERLSAACAAAWEPPPKGLAGEGTYKAEQECWLHALLPWQPPCEEPAGEGTYTAAEHVLAACAAPSL
eukprot:scaffold259373_cov22-Tisochrysis_lutea.AAC.2